MIFRMLKIVSPKKQMLSKMKQMIFQKIQMKTKKDVYIFLLSYYVSVLGYQCFFM